MILSNLAKF